MLSGQLTVPNAGTPQQFPVIAAHGRVRITALKSNTGIIAIGSIPGQRIPGLPLPTNGPVASSSSAVEGDILEPGQAIVYDTASISDLWIDAAVDGEGVSFFAAPFAHGPSWVQVHKGYAKYAEPTNIDTTYNNTTTTATSAWIDVDGYLHHTFGFELDKANTPTDITIEIEVDLGDGNAKKLMNWGLGDWRYDDTAVGTGGVEEAYEFTCSAKRMRVVVTATGTSASATFTMANSVLRSHV